MPEAVYTLRPRQYEVFADPSRFRVVVAGRRSGKTFGDCVELTTHAAEKPGARCAYVEPTYKMAKDNAWKQIKSVIPRELVARTHEQDLTLTLVNGSEIVFLGADNPDRLRGPGLDFLVMDEFAWIDPRAWGEVLRPQLSDRLGRALFNTTPCGFNWAYDLYMRGVQGDDGWRSWQYTTADAGIVPESEIEAARRDLDPRVFRQEYEASFETLSGRVYSNFDRLENVGPVEDTGAELLVGMDFNVNPMSCVIAVRRVDECHVLDALEVQSSNTEEVAAELKRRYPTRRIVVCPDPAGNQRKTSAPVGQTDLTILQRNGFEVRAPKAAPPVVDRINNTQAMLLAADGRRRVKIHPRAHRLVRCLDGLTYKEGTSQPLKGELDHLPDALGYLLWSEFNVLTQRNVPIVQRVGL